jgi:hypothetical protein
MMRNMPLHKHGILYVYIYVHKQDHVAGGKMLSRQDKMELAVLSQLDELVRENIFLKRKYAEMMKKTQ